MLLIKFILEDFDRQTPEVKSDMIDAIKNGLFSGVLTIRQVHYLVWYVCGYTLTEIAVHEHITTDRVMELIVAALRYISTVTDYTDERIIYQHKGEIKPQWIAKRDQLLVNM